MIMKKKIITIFPIALLVFISCEKEIKIDTIGSKKQLVINSVFCVNKPLLLRFSYSTPIEKKYQNISDSLHIKLYENAHLIYSGTILSDSLITGILPSNNSYYKISASVNGDSIVALDTVPKQVYITDAVMKNNIGMDEYGTPYSEISVTFTDPANERNYYEMYIPGHQYDHSTKITDPVLINEGDIDYNPTTYFFSDELIDGKTYTMKIMCLGSKWRKMVLRSVSRNYYLYRKYFTRHLYTQPASERDIYGLLHLAEPIDMFTNIKGGLGIFVGYSEPEPFTMRQL